MQTQHLVQASADVITITTLRAGDVYKRLQKRYNDEYFAVIGVVQSVDNNGTDTMISAIEIGDDAVTLKVFGTNTEMAIFAATPDEVAHVAAEVKRTLTSRVESYERQLAEAENALTRFSAVTAKLDADRLQAPATTTKTIAS